MNLNSICFIVNGYPTKEDPEYAFIKTVVSQIADRNINCVVISPQSITKVLTNKACARRKKWFDKTEKGNEVVVYQPYYFSVSNMSVNNKSVSTILREKAIRKVYRKYQIKADVLYGHFWDCAIAAAKISDNKVPVVVVSGESRINVRDKYDDLTIEQCKKCIKEAIFVSSKNEEESRMLNLIDDGMLTKVIPNSYDSRDFYNYPKDEARKKLGLPIDQKVAIFVGEFSDRKGVLRVVEAAKHIPSLKLILIGKTILQPVSDQIIFSGVVPHDELVHYLNASDFFVLPTLAEGCCNAIVEAIACHLPIISSNMSFNKELIDETNSIAVNPNSIDEIAAAMERLYNDDGLVKSLSEGSARKSVDLQLDNRITRILDFISEVV